MFNDDNDDDDGEDSFGLKNILLLGRTRRLFSRLQNKRMKLIKTPEEKCCVNIESRLGIPSLAC